VGLREEKPARPEDYHPHLRGILNLVAGLVTIAGWYPLVTMFGAIHMHGAACRSWDQVLLPQGRFEW
jgi:hypothetical protein